MANEVNMIENNMITLSDYAKNQGITYEAARQHYNKYKEDVGEHAVKQGRTTYFDEDAVRILDSHRKRKENITVDSVELQEECNALKRENETLQAEKTQLMEKIIELQDKKVDTSKYIAIEDHQKLEQALLEKNKEIQKLNDKSKEAEERYKELEKKNEALKKDSDELKSVAIKVSHLANEVTSKMKEIGEKDKEIVELRDKNLEKEKEKLQVEEEKRQIEIEKQQEQERAVAAEEELERVKNASFWARVFKKY